MSFISLISLFFDFKVFSFETFFFSVSALVTLCYLETFFCKASVLDSFFFKVAYLSFDLDFVFVYSSSLGTDESDLPLLKIE